MKVLSVDTSSISLSVALIEKKSLVTEITLNNGETHSKHLMGIIDKVLTLSGLTISDLDGFAITLGPGSFTGQRIGLSSIKGLALATGKPIVGVSSLKALAIQAGISPYLICPMIDARKKEVYFSLYKFEGEFLKNRLKETVSSVKKAMGDIQEETLFVGNGALFYKEFIKSNLGSLAHFAHEGQNHIRASTVAFISSRRFEKFDYNDINLIAPRYIRESDAKMSLVRNI